MPSLGNAPNTCGQVCRGRAEPPRHQQRHEHGKADDEDVPPGVDVGVLEVGDPRAHGHCVGDAEHPTCTGAGVRMGMWKCPSAL